MKLSNLAISITAFIICFLGLSYCLSATESQLHPHGYFPDQSMRSNSIQVFDESLKPFYHGTASGDPLTDRVILWTRITPDNEGPATVSWHIYRDIGLGDKVSWGKVTTDQFADYTVKVDVQGLEPNTTYYYAFEYDGQWSQTGRTRTLPENTDNVKLAVISCVNYQWGYFNALDRIADRKDLNAVIHLGDYFYEYPGGDYNHPDLEADRKHDPNKETIELADYRIRFSQYRLDPMLRRLHQQHPMIAVWDDHESTNDSWSGGADNHSSEEGSWQQRKDNSARAYAEWMPIRLPEPNDNKSIYRSFDFGGLLDLYMLETRLSARDEQIAPKGENSGEVDTLDWQSENRTMLGTTQRDWLISSITQSQSIWKIMGSSVMMVNLPVNLLTNFDAWDGYPVERRTIFNAIRAAGIDNVGALSGDFHMSFGHNLMDDQEQYTSIYDSVSGAGSIGFEFTTPSVTSANLNELSEFANPLGGGTIDPLGQRMEERSTLALLIESVAKSQVPWINHFNSDQHGYILLHATPNHIQADWLYMQSILEPNTGETIGASLRVDEGTKTIYNATNPIPDLQAADLAPDNIQTSVENHSDMLVIGNYPNPANDLTYVNFALKQPSIVKLELFNNTGEKVLTRSINFDTIGVLNFPLDTSSLVPGTYHYRLSTNFASYSRTLVVVR